MRNVDGRLSDLIEQVPQIEALNDGSAEEEPDVLVWRRRAETAVAEKVGQSHPLVEELRRLNFFSISFVLDREPTQEENQKAFNNALNRANAILHAALDAEPRPRSGESGQPSIQINNPVTATANAVSNVTVTTPVELRQILASSEALTPQERGEAVALVPDDPERLDLEKAGKLLSLATRARDLFQPILGYLLAHVDKLPFA